MFFNSIKKINRLRKEINRLFSKGVSIIYLKVTIEKKHGKTDILKNTKLSPSQFWQTPTREGIIEF